MRRVIFFALTITLLLGLVGLTGCRENYQQETTPPEKEIELTGWEAVLEEATGNTVNFYGWGGSPAVNSWLDNLLATHLKEQYNIQLNRIPMNIDEILTMLLSEKQLSVEEGTIDIIWINGENFFTAKESALLYGPFNDRLPNFNQFVDASSVEVKYDFGFPTEGFSAPYGRAQLVFIYDQARLDDPPSSYAELLQLAKQYPGQITYPAPPDFTGSAFVRNIIYEIVGHEQFLHMEPNKEVVRVAIQPAIDFLLEIKPYLWRQGETYPATIAQLSNMFANGEVLLTMNYNPNYAATRIKDGSFPETAQTFLFDAGTVGNTHFLAIPFNAPNKAGALAVINSILSVEMQVSKYDPQNWGDLPVLDPARLTEEEKQLFAAIETGKGALPQSKLLAHRLPEMPANLLPIIEEIWLEAVANQ